MATVTYDIHCKGGCGAKQGEVALTYAKGEDEPEYPGDASYGMYCMAGCQKCGDDDSCHAKLAAVKTKLSKGICPDDDETLEVVPGVPVNYYRCPTCGKEYYL